MQNAVPSAYAFIGTHIYGYYHSWHLVQAGNSINFRVNQKLMRYLNFVLKALNL